MTVSIISCPECATLLLSDTVQCPTCLHVLDAERATDFPIERRKTEAAGSEDEHPCPVCGEAVRRGLVRCWSCGSFMREEIAETYQKLQEAAPDYRFDELPEIEEFTRGRRPTDDTPLLAEDDDFELSPEFALETGAPPAPQEESYALSSTPAATPADAGEAGGPAAAAGDVASPAEPAGGQAAAAAAPSAERGAAPAEPEMNHSVATGGDALLQVAIAEEAEELRRRMAGGRKAKSGIGRRGGFLVYCPNGHRVEVHERHRGQRGRCPRCKAPFFVPEAPPAPEPAPAPEAAAAATGTDTPAPAGGRYRWMEDVQLHVVNPQKLKLKPGSLKNLFDQVDLGFASEELVIVQLAKKNTRPGAPDKKKLAAREAARTHLSEGRPAGEVPAVRHWEFTAESLRQVAVVQPIIYAHESMFGGVPVFGDGRIAVRLPAAPGATDLLFCSFALSGFREFARHVAELYGLERLGEDVGVPLDDSYVELKCHYSEETLRALERVEFYQADPEIKLKLIGRKCAACGLAVSEDARKKEKIGGANGKAIAKAKCPKCQQKFGDISLFALEEPAAPATEEPAEASEPPQALQEAAT